MFILSFILGVDDIAKAGDVGLPVKLILLNKTVPVAGVVYIKR